MQAELGRSFVGRHAELAALHGALAQAVAGRPRIVLLAGEPGIGKTRTAQELVAYAGTQGVLAIWGRCPEEPGAPPYWPWLQLLRRYAALPGTSSSSADNSQAAAQQIAALDPASSGQGSDSAPAPAEADALKTRFRLFDAIAGFWQQAAARQPLLLVLDDLHRADVPSLRLLEFVMAEAGSSRLLVLGTYRDQEVTHQHALSDTLAQLHRHAQVQRLLLGGFSAQETAQFVAAAGVASSELAAVLHDQTEGHPLFLTELARDLLQSGGETRPAPAGAGSRPAPRRVPKGVRGAIGQRLNQLSPPCLALLQQAAVIGRVFAFDLLCRLSVEGEANEKAGERPDERPAAKVADDALAWLHEARIASLIDEAAEPGSWQFAHALVRDTLYDELPAAQRAALHQRIVRALEAMHPDGLTPWLSALAHHSHAAGGLGQAGQAIGYATQAAERATATQAHEEAVRHYRLACSALPAHDDARRGRLLLRLGEAQNSAGDSAQALSTFTEAAVCARRLADATLLAQAAIGFGNAQWRQGSEGSRAVLLIREALTLLPSADSGADTDHHARHRVLLLSALCRALLFANQPDAAGTAYRDAVALARRLNDPLTLFGALSAIVPGRWYPEGLALRIAAAQEGLGMMRQAPSLPWPISTFMGWHTGDLMESGDTAGAHASARSHLAEAQAMGEPFNAATALAALTMIATHEGRFADAEQLARQTLQCGERFDRANASGLFGVQMFTLRRHQGRLHELAPVLKQFLAASQGQAATWRPGLAVLHAELGSRDEAREVVDSLAAGHFAVIAHDAIRIASLAYLAEVCAWLGDTARAATLYQLIRPYAQRNIVFGAHTACFGAGARLLGLLASTLQRWDLAQQHFEFALDFDQRSGGRPWLAWSRHEFAAMLLRRGRPGDGERAAQLQRQALQDADELGMHGLQQRLAASAAAAASPAPAHPAAAALPTPSAASQPGVAGLSPRELQVLRLVAAGKTNQQIAQALHRSPATVAIHVRNILGKAQVANRAEAAAFAVRHGLAAPE